MPTSRLAQRIIIALLLSGLGTAYSQAPAPNSTGNHSDPEKLFAYDRSKDFDLKVASSKDEGGVTVQDVDFAGATPRGGRVKAYLIRPMGDGPFPAVLYFHWLGKPNGDRTEFLAEATAMAKQGTMSL